MLNSEKTTIHLSVIIVNWNTADLLEACLRSIFEHTRNVRFEVIVFDNASVDRTPDVLAKFPQVRAIFHPENLGFAIANNRAAAQATGEYLLLLNPDTELRDNAIGEALAFLRKNPFDILGIRLRLPNGKIQVSSGNFPSLKNMLFQKIYAQLSPRFPAAISAISRLSGVPVSALIDHPALWHPQKIHTTDWVSGAFFLLKRADFLAANGFDERFRLFAEEIDLCKRLSASGKKTVFYGKNEMMHYSGASISQVSAKSTVLHFAAMFRFYRAHRPKAETAIYRWLMRLAFTALLFRERFRLRSLPAEKQAESRQKIDAYRRLLEVYRTHNPDVALPTEPEN